MMHSVHAQEQLWQQHICKLLIPRAKAINNFRKFGSVQKAHAAESRAVKGFDGVRC